MVPALVPLLDPPETVGGRAPGSPLRGAGEGRPPGAPSPRLVVGRGTRRGSSRRAEGGFRRGTGAVDERAGLALAATESAFGAPRSGAGPASISMPLGGSRGGRGFERSGVVEHGRGGRR